MGGRHHMICINPEHRSDDDVKQAHCPDCAWPLRDVVEAAPLLTALNELADKWEREGNADKEAAALVDAAFDLRQILESLNPDEHPEETHG